MVDEVIVATGVRPRVPDIPGIQGENVLSYIDVLRGGADVGDEVVILGAGGIGFDVAEYLAEDGSSSTLDREEWLAEWGIDDPSDARGGLAASGAAPITPAPFQALARHRL